MNWLILMNEHEFIVHTVSMETVIVPQLYDIL